MARVLFIDSHAREDLFVPGTDPAKIVADGNSFLANGRDETDSGGHKVITPVDEVRIGWFHVNPCSPNACGEDHSGHWTPTERPTRGGFQGAMLATGWVEDGGEQS